MPVVYIPAPLRTLTGGETKVTVEGGTLREVLDRLDAVYPGLKNRLVDGDRMASGMAVFVDGAVPITSRKSDPAPLSELSAGTADHTPSLPFRSQAPATTARGFARARKEGDVERATPRKVN